LNFELIIVGAGLGGLVSGIILAREGYHVCILEKNHQPGGNLQTFTRNGHKFSTGLHYIGSMEEGQTLQRFFRYLGIDGKVPLKKLDEAGYDQLVFAEEETRYFHAQGWGPFAGSLIRQFPGEREAIETYVSVMQESIRGIPLYDLENAHSYELQPSQMNRCLSGFLEEITTNRRLRAVLAGANSVYHGAARRTPLYLHACVRNSFVSSAWRITGGSDSLTDALVGAFIAEGGTLITDAGVGRFEFEGSEIGAAITTDGRRFSGKRFISNLHPATTLELVPADKVRRSYRQRIQGLENSAGFFTLYLVFKENFFPYLNHNLFQYYSEDYFDDRLPGDQWPHTFLVYTPFNENNGGYTRTASILSFMEYKDYARWDGVPATERGQDYLEFRENAAQRLLNALEKRFPGIRAGIEEYYISMPLTFTDFTATPNGSGYGILKDCHNPARSIILPHTKIPNLWFTGQNLNIHGVLGTTISAVITSAGFVGFRHLVNKIIHA
jgi:phytoene dehydrogenase-like protein